MGPLVEEPARKVADHECISHASACSPCDRSILGESEHDNESRALPGHLCDQSEPTQSDHENGSRASPRHRCDQSDGPSEANMGTIAP